MTRWLDEAGLGLIRKRDWVKVQKKQKEANSVSTKTDSFVNKSARLLFFLEKTQKTHVVLSNVVNVRKKPFVMWATIKYELFSGSDYALECILKSNTFQNIVNKCMTNMDKQWPI